MRALAEFVMRGRAQAVGVVVAGLLLPLLVGKGLVGIGLVAPGVVLAGLLGPLLLLCSMATVGLVTLRMGGLDSILVLGWGLLAAVGSQILQDGADVGPAAALLATTLGAVMLRWTSSWALALVTLVAVGLITAVALNSLGSGYVDRLVVLLNELLVRLRAELPADVQNQLLGSVSATQVSGWLGFWTAMSGLAGLLLARHWQAMLYNPGGFGREFRELRLSSSIALGMVVLGAALIALGSGYHIWLMLAVLPFLVGGAALVHGMAALKNWGRVPLVVMYVGALLQPGPVMTTLFTLALIDSWIDFRGRLRARQS